MPFGEASMRHEEKRDTGERADQEYHVEPSVVEAELQFAQNFRYHSTARQRKTIRDNYLDTFFPFIIRFKKRKRPYR